MPAPLRREVPRARPCFKDERTHGSPPALPWPFPEDFPSRHSAQSLDSTTCAHTHGSPQVLPGTSPAEYRQRSPGHSLECPTEYNPEKRHCFNAPGHSYRAVPERSQERPSGECPEQSAVKSPQEGIASTLTRHAWGIAGPPPLAMPGTIRRDNFRARNGFGEV